MAGVSRPAEVDGTPEPTGGDLLAAAPIVAARARGPISSFSAWVDRYGPAGWLIFVGLFVAEVAWCHLVLWATGRLAVGSFDQNVLIFSVYAPYSLAALTFGRRIARDAVVRFWPATGWPAAEQAAWIDRFSFAPARVEWAALVVGFVAGLGALLAAPASVLGSGDGRIASAVAYVPLFLMGYGPSTAAIVISAQWLWLVDRIHREARAVDPFDREPIYAFSRLTVIVGVTIVGAAYFSWTVNAGYQVGNLPSLLFTIATVPVGILAFVAPLWGIHERLAREKDALALDVERRITRAAEELYGRVDAGTFDDSKAVTDALAGLTGLRERIARLPTWPWPPQLLRGFLTALFLPIIVYIVGRAISAASGI
jgi:hypothetical protein